MDWMCMNTVRLNVVCFKSKNLKQGGAALHSIPLFNSFFHELNSHKLSSSRYLANGLIFPAQTKLKK
ncbi:CLUMA_CG006702, isoform A [Clunio marinus]|uniref:CLUMA_CG006702, isoform A n=1 Tax=Clunio marinus TaxID=568069 RepID=A0A1J1I2I7_9DIPT|nr:CLUMA_CG006702, isoform A [Clunio marinus]